MKATHLIDDRRMGGVTRFLQQLTALRPQDKTEFLPRGTMRARKYDADVIASHLAISWRSLPMLIALRACNPKAHLIHIEHSYSRGFEAHRVPRKRRFHTLLRTAYSLFDEVICVSKGQAEWMQETGILPSGKLRVAPPLVDLDPFLQLPDPVFGQTRRYGFVGRLDQQKGIDLVVKAWRAVNPTDATLEIYGDGPMREDLEAIAAGDTSIRFHGRLDDPSSAYNNIDVAVMPSRWEPYGLSCLEARATGRPVMLANIDGLTEQIGAGGGKVIENTQKGWEAALTDPKLDASIRLEAGIGRRSARRDAEAAVTFWKNFSHRVGEVSNFGTLQQV